MKLWGCPLEVVILDVDGVIIDLESGFAANFSEAVEAVGLPLDPFLNHIAAVKLGIERHRPSFADAAVYFWPNISPTKTIELETNFRANENKRTYPAIKGSIETVKWLRSKNIKLALCTTNTINVLNHRLISVGIIPAWFLAISTWENGFPKPDPRALNSIFTVFDSIPKSYMIFVGDWLSDWETARGAGVKFVAVLSGGVAKETFLSAGVPGNSILNKLADLKGLLET